MREEDRRRLLDDRAWHPERALLCPPDDDVAAAVDAAVALLEAT
ncbi:MULTISPECIES: hypothetical protein [Microbispora]|jgi:hypothetical protein|uniref:Uncharacterized protein n=2 Tax=Microbispora hainanensis TaxID=568844 RepID=A0ABZ1SNM6_9ACTN|nr:MULTISPECIES: hypothetical protein [Microbispora]